MYELALLVISFIVYLRLLFKKNAWGWIVLYWGVLVLKNACGLTGGI